MGSRVVCVASGWVRPLNEDGGYNIMLQAVLVVAAIVCAIQAIRSGRLLVSALWLAGVSALVATLFYAMGAFEVAVIELSVGAGLVTVLFVFAIGVAGDELATARSPLPWSLAVVLVGLTMVVLIWLLRGVPGQATAGATPAGVASFAASLWMDRALDAIVQIVLIFTGVVGVLGLLADSAGTRRAGNAASAIPHPIGPGQQIAAPSRAEPAQAKEAQP